jgi:hypothetical protein
MVFTPHKSRTALRHMYDTYRTELWGPYGFKDAFNPSANWFSSDYLGVDQGPIVLMIENMRTRRIWETTMRSPIIQRALQQAGFAPASVPAKVQTAMTTPVLEANARKSDN